MYPWALTTTQIANCDENGRRSSSSAVRSVRSGRSEVSIHFVSSGAGGAGGGSFAIVTSGCGASSLSTLSIGLSLHPTTSSTAIAIRITRVSHGRIYRPNVSNRASRPRWYVTWP